MPNGDGRTCTLYIYSYLEEPVMLHATVTNRCGTVTTDFAIKTTYFGVDEMADDERFVISPNPSNGQMTLRLDQLEGMAEISVYKSSGQLVDTFVVNANAAKVFEYTLPDRGDGLYFLVLRNNGATLVRKLSVVR